MSKRMGVFVLAVIVAIGWDVVKNNSKDKLVHKNKDFDEDEEFEEILFTGMEKNEEHDDE